ncbi:MAG: hypothetical protein AAGJ18_21955 [Bacteroidota bacterium]
MFEKKYPNLSWWMNNQGWIELGSKQEGEPCWLTVYDAEMPELAYEDDASKSLEAALRRAEKWTAKKINEEFDIYL